MSGDVQPRKRKDKKKKKDELGGEEPRGTAAALGDGDVFIHSQQDHGTGGHWCAKIIFFSLLAVLITLIGLIILENRGLTELEANAVESQYSGILEGWIEDSPVDDHHDEHTLDLKHHDDEGEEEHNVEELDQEDDEEQESDHEDEDEEDQESDHEDDDEDEDSNEENIDADEDEEDQEESQEEPTEGDEDEEENVVSNEEQDDENQSEENLEEDDDNEEVEEKTYNRYKYNEDDDEDNTDRNDDNDEDQNEDDSDEDDDQNYEDVERNYVDNAHNKEDEDQIDDQSDEDNERSYEDNDHNNEDDDENDDQSDEDNERNYEDNDHNNEDEDQNYQSDEDGQYDIENDDKELKNENSYSNEITHDEYNDSNELRDNEDETEQEADTQEDDDDDEEIEKIVKEIVDEEVSKEDVNREDGDGGKNDLQDQEEDDDEPPLESITTPPAGKPFVEIEEEIIEKPINTLAEEEEYEKQQEQLRKEEEEEAAQGSQIWLKLAVGGALLVATHAVLRRATAPRDIPAPEEHEHAREETPTIDRRMTLVPEQSPRVQQDVPTTPVTQIGREIEEVVFKKPAPVIKSSPILKQDSEEEVIVKKMPVEEKTPVADTKDEEKELYSDEDEEVEDEEEEEEEDIEEPVKETVQKKVVPVVEQKPTEDSEPEDVEIIDDEQIEEEQEEEDDDEEDVSDVDDTELLNRLEAKYGRLPEPERFGQKPERFGPRHKDGGNSIEDDWPGEPSDAYWRTELNIAEEELRQGAWSLCEKRVSAAALSGSGRARWLAARAMDAAAEARRDNRLLARAVAAYLHLLKMNERLSDSKLLEVAHRTIDRIQFRGTYLNAEPIYRLLIRRFPENVNYRNNLTVSFLMANRADLADEVLKETLLLWPNDRVALAHHGFVLKTQYNKLEDAVTVLYKALEGDTGPANEPRFYYHLGDALLLLGRFEEAHEVHKRGAALGHFLSPSQRSLYNIPRLKSRPWWPVEETPYVNLARALERSWREILKEGEAAKALYEKEKEGLRERGEWSQLDLFVRGAEIPGRCARAPTTCGIVRSEAAAAGCRRGQVKFSAMAAGTRVRPHVGPTNCRLRMHLGLSNTKDTYIRVDKETRQWQTGKTFIFDDSFEHEVWHNGTGSRLVLIVDVWHPELTAAERRTLPAI